MNRSDTSALNLEAFAALPCVTPIGSNKPVSETLPQAVQKIVTSLQPLKVVLFGSYAYGNPTPDSDVDLLIVMATHERDATLRHAIVSRLLSPRPFPVDILAETPESLEAISRKNHAFYLSVLKEGKVLYERRG